jgi:hypothetical protein
MLATSIRNRELSVDRSSTIQLVGRRWVYYRRAALLKESYLLSSLLASFLKFSPCLYASEGEREPGTSVMAHDLRFGARPSAGFTLRHCPCLSRRILLLSFRFSSFSAEVVTYVQEVLNIFNFVSPPLSRLQYHTRVAFTDVSRQSRSPFPPPLLAIVLLSSTNRSGSFHDSSRCSACSAFQYHRPLFRENKYMSLTQNIRLEARSYRL